MDTSFRFVGLPYESFAPYFERTEAQLAAVGARRMVADAKPGFPCRVSLADAEPGETVVLLTYTHHDVASPYRAAGPIFVRKDAVTARPAPGQVPEHLRGRLLSLRAYDAAAMMRNADVVEGARVEDAIRRLFADPLVAYLHVHNARPGCYNCAVVWAS